MSIGETVSGSIGAEDDEDFYALELEKGQTVTVRATNTDGMDGDESLTFGFLDDYQLDYHGDTAYINEPGDSDTGSFTADETGTYYLRVEGDGTSAYEFTVVSPDSGTGDAEPNGNRDTATAISVDETISGSVGTDGDEDFYALELDQGQTVTVRATNTGEMDGDESLTFGFLDDYQLDYHGETAYINEPGDSDTGSFTADSTGTYYLRVEGDGTSAYEFTVVSPDSGTGDAEPNGNRDTATALSVDETVAGSVGTDGDEDFYALELDQGQTVTVRATDTGGLEGDESLTFGFLDDYQLDYHGETAYINEPGDSDTGSFTADETGTYYLRVEGHGTSAYEFTVVSPDTGTQEAEPNGNRDTATSVSVGETRSGSSGADGDEDFYALEVEKGQTVTVRATNTGGLEGDESLTFGFLDDYQLDYHGDTAYISEPGASDTGSFTADSTGTYYLRVEGDGTSAYEFTLFTGDGGAQTSTTSSVPTTTATTTIPTTTTTIPTTTTTPTPTTTIPTTTTTTIPATTTTPTPTTIPATTTTTITTTTTTTTTMVTTTDDLETSTQAATASEDDTETSVQDSDGDGVRDSEDYAPRDPDVQDESDLEDSSDGGVPGFDLAVTLVALLAAALLASRRS